jgi:2-C-methyl-D-erythritol 4-phosphate cytidylyltransferase
MKKNSSKKNCAVIVAAGKGTRMNLDQNKQFINIAGIPVLARTISAFEECPDIDEIVIVINKNDLVYCKHEIVDRYGFKKIKSIAAGGEERHNSVYNGLSQLDTSCGIVLIHDGARPFVDQSSIERSIEAADEYGAACVAVKVKDTIKTSDAREFINGTPDRSRLWQAQTPQSFRYEIIMEAYKNAIKEGWESTDDSALVERMGHHIKLVPGNYLNIKITTQEDLILAEAIVLADRGY